MNDIAFWIGMGAALLLWYLFYGANALVRSWLLRKQRREQEVLAEFEIDQGRLPLQRRWTGLPLGLGLLLFVILYVTDPPGAFGYQKLRFVNGYVFANLVLTLPLFLLLVRTRTFRTERVVFDRAGVSFYLRRSGWVGGGTFVQRLSWANCFGYSVGKGQILFALQPQGHLEQQHGGHRRAFEAVLAQVGLQKLISYDVVYERELAENELTELEARVLRMAEDVIQGYASECAALGIRIQAERMDATELGEASEPFAFLRLGLWVDNEREHQIDWLLWADYGGEIEQLGLADDRLYEALDDRVHTLIERRVQQLGQPQRRARLQ